jgi:hypothetical protein
VHVNRESGRRQEEVSGDREVTLKFRHPGRVLVQDRDMSAEDGAKGPEPKFEEDVKPKPDKPLYSFSTKQRISGSKNLNRMDDPGRLYPGLPERLDAYRPDDSIVKVGGFTANERVITGADFQISGAPKVEAKSALIVWHDAAGATQRPEVAEFSFKYDELVGNQDLEKICDRVLQLLGELTDWVDPASLTKTAFVYSLASPPCP